MTKEAFLEALDQRISRRDLLQHPFYQMWTSGTLPAESLKGYAGQYWHQVWGFPAWLSALHSRATDATLRRAIASNLAEEEGQEVTHPELWLRFGEGIGAPRERVQDSEPLPETAACLALFEALARGGDWREAVAAFYAFEGQVPEIAKAKIAGLAEHFDIEDERTIAYFRLHSDVDVEHAAAWKDLLAEGCSDEASQQAAIEAAGRAADALWGLLDGVQREYVGGAAAHC